MASDADNRPEPKNPDAGVLGGSSPEQAPVGILGDGLTHPGKYNMRLVRRAIREDWPIPPEVRKMLVTQMALVVGRSDNTRDKIGACQVLVAADAINARRETADQRADFWAAGVVMPEDSKSPAGGVTINGDINVINAADGDRSRLDAIARRLGIGGVVENPAANGRQGHPGPNGHPEGGANGRPLGDADDADDEAG